jgi:hypothetical protein
MAFGLSGIALLVAALALVLGSLSVLDDAVSGFERQRAEVVAVLGPASSALTDAATSATNAGTSLTETSEAAARAASLSSSLAESFDGLAALGTFDILGLRPFGALSGQFTAVGEQARTLSTDLAEAAAALGANRADSQAVADDLRSLANQLARLESSLQPIAASPAPNATVPLLLIRLVVLGMLAWFAVPALASTWIGWRLVRRGRPNTGAGAHFTG